MAWGEEGGGYEMMRNVCRGSTRANGKKCIENRLQRRNKVDIGQDRRMKE